MCKHEWHKALPAAKEIGEAHRLDLVVRLMLNPQLGRTYYCPLCKATGHSVYGRKIRKHTSEYFLNEINKARLQFDLLPLTADKQKKIEGEKNRQPKNQE